MGAIDTHIEDALSLITRIKTIPNYLIFFVDLKGNILNWNEGAEKAMGFLEDEVIGRHFSMFYQEDESGRENTNTAIKTALEKGYFERDGWYVKKNGERFWASETITHLKESNSPDGFLVIIHELTKYKETEDIARQWQFMFEKSDWAFAVSPAEKNTFTMVNPAFAKLYGYSADELIGKPITDILDPASQKNLAKNIDIIHSEGHHIYESKHVRKDGTAFPVIVDATAIKDSSGKVLQKLVNVRDISVLKEMQQASAINEEKFQQLFEQASDGIFIADLNGRYTNVNTAACQMLNYTKDELIGKTILDLILPEEAGRLEKQKELLMKSGETVVNEWMLRKKDGTLIPTEISTKILPNGQWQAFVRDISERKKTHEILIRSEQKFRGLLEQYQDPIVIVDKHGRIEFVNNQFSKKFGYGPEEVMGKPLEKLMPERFKMKHVGHRMKYMASPTSRPMGLGLDLYAMRKDGSEFPVDIALVPFETDKGMVFTAFVRDLSDRKRYEARQKFLAETSVVLTESIVFEKQLFNIAQLCIPFLADFCMIFISEKNQLVPKASLHRNKEKEEALKALAADLFSKPEISPYKAGAKTETLKPLVIEIVTDSFLQAMSPSEEQFRKIKELDPKSMLFLPLVARERIIGVMVLVMDGSERKFIEEDISFITLVGYRIGLSLDNINLYNEAQQAIREREDILSIVSHDLRNPLTAIKGGLQLISQLPKGDEQEKINKVISTLADSATFMERLIYDLLDFSKIQQGALPLKLVEQVHIGKILQYVQESLFLKANEKSIDMTFDISKVDSPLTCDPDRMKQVFNNLVGNAIKFTPEGGKVRVHVKEHPERYHFSVSDSGPGISGENLLHIFDRYWQEKKTAHLGTGLGLSIAKGIVEAHRGTMWVESEVGKGSNFQFEIPRNLKIG